MDELKVGDKAPQFEGKNQNGEKVNLSDFKGKKTVLYFYPKDSTPGCTAQACSLAENHILMDGMGYKILGVSVDDEKSHQSFIEKYDLPFDLIADTDKEIVAKYGVWIEKNMYGKKFMGIKRTTFIIDESGTIADIIKKVDTKNHAEQVMSKAH